MTVDLAEVRRLDFQVKQAAERVLKALKELADARIHLASMKKQHRATAKGQQA